MDVEEREREGNRGHFPLGKNGFLCKPRKGHGERGGRTEGGE